jgi:putative peptide zinc metalloprotease protein
MLVILAFVVVSLPRIAATAWDSTALQWEGVSRQYERGAWAGVGVGLIGTVAVLLPVAGTVYMATRILRRAGGATWRAADRLPAGRPLAAVAALAVAAGLGTGPCSRASAAQSPTGSGR